MPGPYNSPESLAENARILALLATNNGRLPPALGELKASGVSINELVLRFMDEHVATTYVDADGKPTSEQAAFKQSVLPLVRLYGPTLVGDFDSAALARVQSSMISGTWMNDAERGRQIKRNQLIGRGRSTVNKAISRLHMMFRWGKIRKLASAELITDLDCLPFLKPGEGGAREYDPVEAVSLETFEGTLPYLPPTTADIIRILQLTGARCGEICSMRVADVDRTGQIWIYRPRKHKTKKRGVVYNPRGTYETPWSLNNLIGLGKGRIA
jgi:integrase